MIDIAAIEAHMRDANPIRHLDEVDPDELSFAVAVAHTRRASIMQAPTQYPTPTTPLPPPPPRRKAWAAVAAAFVSVLAAIGVAALVLRGGDGEVADTPTVPTTVVEPDVATTGTVEEPTGSALLDGNNTYDAQEFYAAWQQVAVGEPWVDTILDIEALPEGGFVIVTVEPYPSNVLWSPDGVEWFNADPQQLLPPFTWSDWPSERTIPLYNRLGVGPVPVTLGAPPANQPGLIAVSGPTVALVDPHSTAVFFGDPTTGDWTSVDLDTSGLTDHVQPAFVAAHGDLLLVAGWVEVTDPPTDPDTGDIIPTVSLVGWIVDTERGTAAQTPMPAVTALSVHAEAPELAWFDGRWLLLAGEPNDKGYYINYSLWTARDAASWSELVLPSELGYLSLTVGTHSVTIGNRGAGPVLHSTDLADWQQTFAITSETYNPSKPAYSDALGYVILLWRTHDELWDVTNRVVMSVDGVDWQDVGPARPDLASYAVASGDRLLVYDNRPEHRLWVWSMD